MPTARDEPAETLEGLGRLAVSAHISFWPEGSDRLQGLLSDLIFAASAPINGKPYQASTAGVLVGSLESFWLWFLVLSKLDSPQDAWVIGSKRLRRYPPASLAGVLGERRPMDFLLARAHESTHPPFDFLAPQKKMVPSDLISSLAHHRHARY